jgi:hypothetical protein
LTKILQEKAELLKRKRQAAEAAAQSATERLQQLTSAEVLLPEAEAREASLKELIRHSDWDGVESGAKAFQAYLEREGAPLLDARRKELVRRMAQLKEAGFPVQEEVPPLLEESATLQGEGKWKDSIERFLAVLESVRIGEARYAEALEGRTRALAEWAHESPDNLAVALAKGQPFFEAIRAGTGGVGLPEFTAALERDLPAVASRRKTARATAEGLAAVATELGVHPGPLKEALAAEAAAPILDTPTSIGHLDLVCEQAATAVRDRVLQTLETYRATLASLRDSGTDPQSALARLEELVRLVPSSPPSGIPQLIAQAREAAEEPVVAVVASLLDEVRPKLVEARRLGRNSSEVFAAMNRAREALRLRIYGEALAASQEALEQVSKLTEDLDTTREEVESVDALLGRLSSSQFPVGSFEAPLAEVRALLDRMELATAETKLRSTVERLGGQAIAFFQEKLEELERLRRQGSELGFTPAEFGNHLSAARALLAEGSLAEAAETCARLEVELRSAAQPYIARRLDEITRSLEEIPDPSLIDPVRRLLADADVSLRVKEDLKGSLETMHRAEREFSVVFAEHASTLVEALEGERRTLEGMGAGGEEIQRQIDEVQQIFNMGDFVKAFRAAQEIRKRAHEQQLVRSEEAVSHAKLALVELGKLGVDTVALKATLDKAQNDTRDGLYPAAYGTAQQVMESAQRLRTTAQASLDRIVEVTEQWEALKASGVPVQPYAEQLVQARGACQSLEFDRARQIVDALHEQLDLELGRFEAGRLMTDAVSLLEDGRRLGLPMDGFAPRVTEIKQGLEKGGSRELWNRARSVHNELIGVIRPVAEEMVRSLERDVEIARSAELDVASTVELLAEVRRRLALPVPLGVAEVLDEARARFFETKGFLEHAERLTKRAQEALNRAELVRVDVRPFRPRLERVERHLSERDYARVIDLASGLERELGQATTQQVSKTLASFQGMLTQVRRDGGQTTLAENLLEQARHALDRGEPTEALNLAAQSERELERVELQVLIAQSSLEVVEHRFLAASHSGLKTPEAEKEFAAARADFDSHDYPKVLEHCITFTDALTAATDLHRRAREAIETTERQLREATEMSAELGEVLPIIEQARERLTAGEYEMAIRRAREASESARWAIERLYAGPLAELQELIELVRSTGTEADVETVRAARDEAEAAVKLRDWSRGTSALGRGRELASAALDRAVESGLRSLEMVYQILPEAPAAEELEHRQSFARRVEEERGARNHLAALEMVREEESRAREHLKQELHRRVSSLQERLWVGEKVGVDTTPVMEVFSEAKLSMEAGRLEPVAALVQRGSQSLEALVRHRIEEKLGEVETELVFARDGLHVTLGPVPEKFDLARKRLAENSPVEAAKALLEAEEDLNRRKALHRELMNLHFLVDAALSRATERRLDTSRARQLLDESLKARVLDYAPALEKAREALRVLQESIGRVDPASLIAHTRPRANSPS